MSSRLENWLLKKRGKVTSRLQDDSYDQHPNLETSRAPGTAYHPAPFVAGTRKHLLEIGSFGSRTLRSGEMSNFHRVSRKDMSCVTTSLLCSGWMTREAGACLPGTRGGVQRALCVILVSCPLSSLPLRSGPPPLLPTVTAISALGYLPVQHSSYM